jgi:hypothetical protein
MIFARSGGLVSDSVVSRGGSMQQEAPKAVLRRLDAFVGEWELQAAVDGQPVGCARVAFDWLEGGAFLLQRARADPGELTPTDWQANSPFPLVGIIGLDDWAETFSMLYADARGISRVYTMSLADGVWKIWRDAPGFCQRFTGMFSDDEATISGRWEASHDGEAWEPDFDVTYRRLES